MSFLLIDQGNQLDQVNLAEDVAIDKPEVGLSFWGTDHSIEDVSGNMVAQVSPGRDIVQLARVVN